jgi:hypothetical protein
MKVPFSLVEVSPSLIELLVDVVELGVLDVVEAELVVDVLILVL